MEASSPLEVDYGVASLTTISWERLLQGDLAEAAALLAACKEAGFFYLDLSGVQSKEYREKVAGAFKLSEGYFAKSSDEKMLDYEKDIDVFNLCGFKPLGKLGLDAGNMKNKKNGCEHLRIPADALFNANNDPRLVCPSGVRSSWPLLQDYISLSHEISVTILSRLSNGLHLEDEERFEYHHSRNSPSTSIAALQHYPSTDLPSDTSIGHFAHTDTGSLTVLFSTDWGLQAYSSTRNTWEHVAPRSNCAIINVGDTLRFLSGLRLTSSLHRVVPWHRPRNVTFVTSAPTARVSSEDTSTIKMPTSNEPLTAEANAAAKVPTSARYSCIYFLRPNNTSTFLDGDGKRWHADNWLRRKFQNYRASHDDQELNSISTGLKGFTGILDEKEQQQQQPQALDLHVPTVNAAPSALPLTGSPMPLMGRANGVVV